MTRKTSNDKKLDSVKLILTVIGGTITILISFIALIVELIKSIG